MIGYRKSGGWVLSLLAVSLLLSACGRGKQEAAVSLDEARLNVSGARNEGAETYAPQRLAEASSALSRAEKAFKQGKYDQARSDAARASGLANAALAEAKSKSARKASTKDKAKGGKKK